MTHRQVKWVATLLLAFGLTNSTFAEEIAFTGVKLADAKGKHADRDFVTVPYNQLDKFSYEYTKKHRITQGAIVMVASLGAGAIVMLTKSKSHWLYIAFH